MSEEEFEDRLGIKHGWGKPIGYPKWPLLIPAFAWILIFITLGWFLYHLPGWLGL